MGGSPMFLLCPVERRERTLGRSQGREAHQLSRTGETRPNPSRKRSSRVLDTEHRYRCTCGHIGWSRLAEILDRPLATDTHGGPHAT